MWYWVNPGQFVAPAKAVEFLPANKGIFIEYQGALLMPVYYVCFFSL
jgi:hypothetical protein